MLVQLAEDSYHKGMNALEGGRGREALAFFEAAIELERRLGGGPPQARYLSHYGFCLGTVMQRQREGARFCREATNLERYNPDLHCNLGRMFAAMGRLRDAHRAFTQGLDIQSDHPGIVRALNDMGVRRKPVIPFLARSNPVNICLGRMRTRR